MVTFFILTPLGVLFLILGAINMTGNISSLHWYHRQRVAEEDKKPLGQRVGIGMLLIGLCIIAFAVLLLLTEKTGKDVFVLAGTAALLTGMAISLVLILGAIHKYNKGIF